MKTCKAEGAARTAKWRAKKKEDREAWDQYLKKDRERNRLSREKEKDKCEKDEYLLQKKREQTRQRVREWRKKKATEKSKLKGTSEKSLGSYASTSTLKKAVYKVHRNLPCSPSKKKAVIRQLVKETFDKPNDVFSIKKLPTKRTISEDVCMKVKQFFERDDISWQTPGKRDVISVNNDKQEKKVKRQKRYMIMSISEAYKLFMEEHTLELKLSQAKFYELRPQHVRPVSETPHNVCVCIEHSNFRFLAEAISKFCNTSGSVNTPKTLIESMCCRSNIDKCMLNKCTACHYDVQILLQADCDVSQQTKWKKWEKTINGQLQVVDVSSSIKDLVCEINSCLRKFKVHMFVKNEQAMYFEEKKKTLKTGDAVMQVDYAENYSLISQDEVQSAHWHHAQVTIFTCCLWLEGSAFSYAIVSDDLTHSKQSAWTFLQTIIFNFQQEHPDSKIQNLYIFSDNCSSQFKSRYTTFNMCYLANDLKVESVEWNYFAAGHGKGAVDAIGGQVKRMVWTAIKARRVSISSAEEFYLVAKELCKTTKILYVKQADIQERAAFLEKRWEKVREVSGIRKFHHITKMDDLHIYAGLTSKSVMQTIQVVFPDPEVLSGKQRWAYSDVYSDSEDESSGSRFDGGDDVEDNCLMKTNEEPTHSHVSSDSINPGAFVEIKITGEGKSQTTHKYIAVCQTNVNNLGDLRVIFLKKYGNSSKTFVPDEEDEKEISIQQVLSVLKTPAIREIGSRIIYVFD